jgi:alpha-tubulin suppressor-like RCC1 family protein
VTATTTTTTTTTAPPTTAPQVKVARGISHSCSWTQLGGVWCWGSNHQGELGHLGYGSNTPVKVEGLPRNIRKVVAADHTTCAAGDEDGARVAYCWGYRLGGGADADPVSAWGPNQVRLPNVTDVALGTSGQVCVVSTSGDASSIYCWGDGWSHVGTGGFDGGHFTSKPVLVGTYRHVHELEVGYRTARAHVGFDDGGCGWIAWGEGYGYGVVARI